MAERSGKFSDDALLRLERPLPGARQSGVSPLVLALHERNDRKLIEPRKVRVREPRWSGKARESQAKVHAGPYAPQLIRLVRHPYALATTYGRRAAYREAIAPLAVREPTPRAMRQAIAELPDLYRPRATELHEAPTTPWRPWQVVLPAEEGR